MHCTASNDSMGILYLFCTNNIMPSNSLLPSSTHPTFLSSLWCVQGTDINKVLEGTEAKTNEGCVFFFFFVFFLCGRSFQMQFKKKKDWTNFIKVSNCFLCWLPQNVTKERRRDEGERLVWKVRTHCSVSEIWWTRHLNLARNIHYSLQTSIHDKLLNFVLEISGVGPRLQTCSFRPSSI